MADTVARRTPAERQFLIRRPWRFFAVAVSVMAVGSWLGTRIDRQLVRDKVPLSSVEGSLLVAAYYRGMTPSDRGWVSNSDQILTLSLFYTGDISPEECVERFSRKSYVGGLYQDDGELTEMIETRYRSLLRLLREHPELIEGGGDFETPADPTYTSCRLTVAGEREAGVLKPSFREKPEFPNWPDKRTISGEL